MSPNTPEHEFSRIEKPAFADKFRDLLPSVEFKEPIEMLEARTAVLEVLTRNDQDSDLLRFAWVEYAKTCEQVVDNHPDTDPHIRAQLHIVMLVHKALLFHEIGDTQRYGEILSAAEEYAYNRSFEIAEAIGIELDSLTQ